MHTTKDNYVTTALNYINILKYYMFYVFFIHNITIPKMGLKGKVWYCDFFFFSNLLSRKQKSIEDNVGPRRVGLWSCIQLNVS